jgi:hypothetical protein
MGIHKDFGNDWKEVVNPWCLGLAPPVEEGFAWQAMLAVEQFWPEYLDEVLAIGARSRLVIADLVDYGRTLQICKDLEGFERDLLC